MGKTYIENVSMENADNGVIISYRQCTIKDPKKGNTYDNTETKYPKEVYDVDDDDDSEDSELNKAFERYKELFLEARAYAKSKGSY